MSISIYFRCNFVLKTIGISTYIYNKVYLCTEGFFVKHRLLNKTTFQSVETKYVVRRAFKNSNFKSGVRHRFGIFSRVGTDHNF